MSSLQIASAASFFGTSTLKLMMSSTLCVSAEQNCTSPFSTDTSSLMV